MAQFTFNNEQMDKIDKSLGIWLAGINLVQIFVDLIVWTKVSQKIFAKNCQKDMNFEFEVVSICLPGF